MQLEWQVAASSCYENEEEMCGLIGSGASTAAEFMSPEGLSSISGKRRCAYPQLGLLFPSYLIC